MLDPTGKEKLASGGKVVWQEVQQVVRQMVQQVSSRWCSMPKKATSYTGNQLYRQSRTQSHATSFTTSCLVARS